MRIQGPLVTASLLFFVITLVGFHKNIHAAEAVPGEFLVKVKKPFQSEDLQKISQNLQSEIKSTIENRRIVVIRKSILEEPKSVIERLSKNPLVEIVEPNYIFRAVKTPNDADFGKLWGLKNIGQSDSKNNGVPGIDIDAEKAWDITTGSSEVVVAVIDTGIDYDHPDLKDNMWVNEIEASGKSGVDDDNNGYIDDIHGINVVDDKKPTADPMDNHGHGSHCAGTIGGFGDDSKGIVGVNWNVSLMAVKFLGADGSGTLEGAIKAIDYATEMGAQILSNSWGGDMEDSRLLQESIERSDKAGTLFVAAAGNDALNIDVNSFYPGGLNVPNILTVAAIDNQGRLAPFSNFGKKTVHVGAPGVNIYSSIVNGYDSWSGTSMATPHVSGIAALLLSHEPQLTGLDLKERLINTVKPITALRNKVSSNGLVNAYFALTNQVAPPNEDDPINWKSKELKISSAHPYGKKENTVFEVKVDGAKEFAIYFERFELEKDYDKIIFYDKNDVILATMTATLNDSYSPTFKGDFVKFKLVTDDSVEKYGFDVTKVSYR